MLNCDMHIHSSFSIDCISKMKDICNSAIKKKIKVICITDHIDFDIRDEGYKYYKADEYFKELKRCKELFKDKLLLLSGIEFSEPHLHKLEFEKIVSKNYDMIMGSIHWIDDGFVGDKKVLNSNTIEELENKYYNDVIKAIKFGGFDTFAHLDFPKRYHKKLGGKLNEKIDVILKMLIEKEIALEINTSSMRKGLSEFMPSNEVIKRYINFGGKMITIGSDAHFVEDIAKDFDDILYEYYNYVGVFIKRKFIHYSKV